LNKFSKHYPTGLDGRQRDGNGEIREKRGDTLVRTLHEEYGDQAASAIGLIPDWRRSEKIPERA
jgi:hypothetical protein